MTTTTPLVETDLRSCIDSDVLGEVLTVTWATFVDPDADLVPMPPTAPRLAMVADVAVAGPTPALISLGIDHEGARSVTRAMLRRGIGGLSRDEDDYVVDAMGELANVLGGNLKALLPEGSTLGLPGVTTRTIGAGGTQPELSVQLAWGRHVVTVTVTDLPRDATDGAAA